MLSVYDIGPKHDFSALGSVLVVFAIR